MAPPDPRAGAFFDLSDRAKIRVTGADRIRFLNGQITNNLAKASASTAIAACILNAKGKMNAHVFASAQTDAIILDADPELRETLPARLERYVIADDVQLENITERFSLFHLFGSTHVKILEGLTTVVANRFGQPGLDIWLERSRHEEVFQDFSRSLSFCDADCAEVFRIEQGIPRWGRELTEEIIPPEANLESSCVDYEKGCYIGQEVVSRMKMSGQRNKKLCGLVSLHDAPLTAGMKLYPMGAEKKERGWITSAAWSDRFKKQIALAYIKRPFFPVGGQLDAIDPENLAGSALVRVEVVDLPFLSSSGGK